MQERFKLVIIWLLRKQLAHARILSHLIRLRNNQMKKNFKEREMLA